MSLRRKRYEVFDLLYTEIFLLLFHFEECTALFLFGHTRACRDFPFQYDHADHTRPRGAPAPAAESLFVRTADFRFISGLRGGLFGSGSSEVGRILRGRGFRKSYIIVTGNCFPI